MQTFLTYPDFEKSACALDDKRLYKQIVECKQILETIEIKKNLSNKMKNNVAWANHPAVLMWEGHEEFLKEYMGNIFYEWVKRRYPMLDFCLNDTRPDSGIAVSIKRSRRPPWLKDERLHKSHRANLYWKDPTYHSHFVKEYEELTGDKTHKTKPPYWWPVTKDNPEGEWK